jgi:glycogen phosphorylase
MNQLLPTKFAMGLSSLSDVDGIDSLVELALDLSCAWNHAADEIWHQLDPDLWELTHNPWAILQTVSRNRVAQVTSDPVIRKTIEELVQHKRKRMETPGWFQQTYAQSTLSCIAYFSMEFMLSEALPIYSGGLGNVAGDQLKAASDLGVPVVGVGLLYQRGYFRQLINQAGAQQAYYPYNDPGQLPIQPVRNANGEWLRLKIALPGYILWLRAWQARVGRTTLYLLDSNDPANFPPHQGITSELYGGGAELRLQQELILGVGGWRLLEELELAPEVCHLNEGHAAFAVLERARSFMKQTDCTFHEALTTTRAGNLFTTHTAVTAGFDLFLPALIEQYLGHYARKQLGITVEELLDLGRMNCDNSTESFNMAYLAIRGSGAVNGVSQLHGQVSRKIFQPLFAHWPKQQIPVGHITNGVHMPSWDSPMADELWTNTCGHERWLGTSDTLAEDVQCINDEKLWEFRTASTTSLIAYTRKRLARHLAVSGADSKEIDEAKKLFDPNILTLGFARRFATYKRPNLLLHDPERLLRLLTNANRPVQLILAGKAHPADQQGQALIQQWMHFIRQSSDARKHVIFLSDYDMLLTERLVQGVDVWVNTPRRPWEACGTSGMKVLVNGGINLSELDGWWAEAYSPEVGWALGDGREHDGDPQWDAQEANALYDLLEQEVIPEFYTRDDRGIPLAWVTRMRKSMSQLTPLFSAGRAVQQYTETYYLPAAEAYTRRTANSGQLGKQIADWQKILRQQWDNLRFGEAKTETRDGQHIVEIQVYVDGIDLEAVRVELYAEGLNDEQAVSLEMTCISQLVGAVDGYNFRASVSSERPISDYTARIVPFFDGVSVPLESPQIRWQK